MFNLKLFTQLQGENTASLLLRPSKAGMMQFFIMSSSVNHSIVVSGECEGELPTMAPVSFDVVLASVSPLLDKNYNFRLEYTQGHLRFVDVQGRFTVEPLCVEHISSYVVDLTKKYMTFVETLGEQDPDEDERTEERLLSRLAEAKEDAKRASIVMGSGFVSDSPWGEAKGPSPMEQRAEEHVVEIENELEELRTRRSKLKRLNFEPLRRITNIAAKYNAVISMCDDYAIVNLDNVFVIQVAKCGIRAVQAKLFQRLLMEPTGNFYEFNDEVVFYTRNGKGRDATNIVVFLQPYLPNTTVDQSIAFKGAVLEKYSLNVSGIFRIISTVSSRFNVMSFDMGRSNIKLENDNGESLVCKFEVEDAKTVELNKLLRGEQSGQITMSTIEIPPAVQRILSSLQDKFTIYVKSRKIVLQSDKLYVVFAR